MRRPTATTGLNVGFQYPNQPTYTDAGKETYNLHDPALAKHYLAQAGYKGEPVVLLTNKDYTSMYNAALVMAEQLKAVGHQRAAESGGLADVDRDAAEAGFRLELFLHRLGHRALARADPDHAGAGAAQPGLFAEARPRGSGAGGRLPRHDACCRRPKAARRRSHACRSARWSRPMSLPFGSLTKVQAVRSNVKGFKPFRIPRMSNVWFAE